MPKKYVPADKTRKGYGPSSLTGIHKWINKYISFLLEDWEQDDADFLRLGKVVECVCLSEKG